MNEDLFLDSVRYVAKKDTVSIGAMEYLQNCNYPCANPPQVN